MCKDGTVGLIEARFLLLTCLCYVAHKWPSSKSKQLHGEGGQTDRARLRLACQSLAAHQKCQLFVLLPTSKHHSNIQHIIYPPIIPPLSRAVRSQESTISSRLEKKHLCGASNSTGISLWLPDSCHVHTFLKTHFVHWRWDSRVRCHLLVRKPFTNCMMHGVGDWISLVCVFFVLVAHFFKSVGCWYRDQLILM